MENSSAKMSPEVYERIKEVVVSVLDCDPKEWPALLVERCGDDLDVFFEACSLVAASRGADSFIEGSALDLLGLTSKSADAPGMLPEE